MNKLLDQKDKLITGYVTQISDLKGNLNDYKMDNDTLRDQTRLL